DEGEYHGRFVDIEPTWLWPKPLQRPHPPIWLGAMGPVGFRHLAEFGDGWIPLAGSVSKLRPQVDEALTAAGRDPPSLPTSVIAPIPSVEAFLHYRRQGVTSVILHAPYQPDQTLRALDEFDEIIATYRKEIDG